MFARKPGSWPTRSRSPCRVPAQETRRSAVAGAARHLVARWMSSASIEEAVDLAEVTDIRLVADQRRPGRPVGPVSRSRRIWSLTAQCARHVFVECRFCRGSRELAEVLADDVVMHHAEPIAECAVHETAAQVRDPSTRCARGRCPAMKRVKSPPPEASAYGRASSIPLALAIR